MDSETQAIRNWLKEHSISEVECLVPDMTGNARGKFIPAPQFLASGQPRLPEGILIQSVTGQYCEEHWDLVEPTDSDMILRPDINTMRVVPWAREPTAQIIHDCYTRGGELHPLSTRNVLRRVLDLYAQQGLQPVVAPEVEFFLVAKNTDPDYELSAPQGRSGRAETSRRSYSIDAVAEFEDFVEDIYDYAEAQGLQVGALIHEDGAAQMEMNFEHGDAMSLADQVFVFKRTVRETAHKYGMYATFMAKPMQRETGSAMHIHQSVVRTATGENIFSDGKGGFSEAFLSYIAGLQHYTPQLISLYAPNVNSYRRFAPEVAAPISLYWGVDNRTTGFRVPRGSAEATRIENRFPGADVNPYLAFAATLASGYLGMQKKMVPTEPHQGTANEDSVVQVVRTLEEGLRHLQESPEVGEIFGDLFLRAYSAVKRQEFEEFNRVISSWEREHLLLQV
jgi:glutamine synthetase